MQKAILTLTVAAFISLAGCQSMPEKQAEAPAKPALSAEATTALSKAEADVKGAKSSKALWTNADDALKKAKEAAEKGDSAAVIKESQKASSFAAMGMQQLSYPSTEKK